MGGVICEFRFTAANQRSQKVSKTFWSRPKPMGGVRIDTALRLMIYILHYLNGPGLYSLLWVMQDDAGFISSTVP